jgi:hypothetical protein
MNQNVKDIKDILNFENNLVVYSRIQTTPGQSGSPIFLESKSKNALLPEY